MRKILWGIASYKRADRQPWLQKLHEWGYGKEDIVISTQTEEDAREYREKWGDMATVIYRQGECISDNKNTIMEYVAGDDRELVMCSDKVRGILMLTEDGKGTWEVETREQLEKVLEYMMATRDALKGEVAGCYSVDNAFYMSHTVHVNQQMLGCFMLFKPGTQWRFERECRLKEDFELCMRIISRGERVVRFNFVALKATLHTKGGCHEMWNSEGDRVNEECTEWILKKYPKLARKHPTRKNEIKYVGPTKRIDVRRK